MTTMPEAGIGWIVFAGQVAIAAGLLTLGLWLYRRVLYGLSLPLIASLVLVAFTIIGMALAVVIGTRAVELVFSTLNQFAHMLPFYRAVYRPYEVSLICFA